MTEYSVYNRLAKLCMTVKGYGVVHKSWVYFHKNFLEGKGLRGKVSK